MARLLKLLIILILAAALVGSSAYVFLMNGTKNGDDGGDGGTTPVPDTTPPTINSSTVDTIGSPGKTTQINAQYWDNKGVTSAILYYRIHGETTWKNLSMIPNGFADIVIPVGDTANYEFYITVDDAAGNGPVGAPSTDGSTYYTITVQQQNVTLVHNVFIEEGTTTWCTNCPWVADSLHNLESLGTYHFFYVALIADMNPQALARTVEYNEYGYPELYIDGGYYIILGTKLTKEETQAAIAENITAAENRDVPPLLLTVSALFDNTTNQTTIVVMVTNYGSSNYAGTLRVYLAQRNSYPYSGGTGIYHHGFVSFLTNESITVTAAGTEIKNYTLAGNSSYVANLEVLAAVFSNQGIPKDSYPPNGKNNSFNAFNVDACNSTLIVPGGKLPPAIGITFPTAYSLNIFNRHILKEIKPKTTTCYGRFTVTALELNGSAIVRVEFYLDGKLVQSLTAAPYSWKWPLLRPSLGLKKHTITVTAYDASGESASTSITIRVRAL